LPESDNRQLIDAIYPDFEHLHHLSPGERTSYLGERVILAAKNIDVDALNDATLDLLPDESKTYHSADEAFDDSGTPDHSIPQEYLNSISISGMPLHLTTLKVGSVVILLRNMDYAGGLCNGTRLIIVDLGNHIIRGKILTGKHRGETAFIPRISLDTASSSGLPFTLRRRQFPV